MFPKTSTFLYAHDTLDDTDYINFIGYVVLTRKKF